MTQTPANAWVHVCGLGLLVYAFYGDESFSRHWVNGILPFLLGLTVVAECWRPRSTQGIVAGLIGCVLLVIGMAFLAPFPSVFGSILSAATLVVVFWYAMTSVTLKESL